MFHFANADPAFPLFAFVFLVALGIDYNIFLMTRVREETLEHGTRPGILRGLAVTGGVITSAGVVLAATFAVLGVLPMVFLAELGFAVAFGVLLDTIVVRSILVPGAGLRHRQEDLVAVQARQGRLATFAKCASAVSSASTSRSASSRLAKVADFVRGLVISADQPLLPVGDLDVSPNRS